MDDKSDGVAGKYRLELVEKVVEVLAAFTPDKRNLTLAEITQRTEQSGSSVYRIVSNLTRLGLLERNEETRKFSIGIRAYSIGSLAVRDIRQIARPRMEQLCARHGCTVNLVLRDGTHTVLVEVLESDQPFRVASSVGSREPLHCTASGKCLLAFTSEEELVELLHAMGRLRRYSPKTLITQQLLLTDLTRIRQTVVALDRGEYRPQARCVAVPIFDSEDTVCAAVSASGPRELFATTGATPIVRELLTIGAELSKQLGSVSGYPSSLLRKPQGAPKSPALLASGAVRD